MDNLKKYRPNWQLPEYIFASSVLFVVVSLVIFYLIDVRNFFNLRNAFFGLKPDYFFFTYYPFFFQHWGRNSGLAELIQWGFLASSALIASFSAGMARLKNNKISIFWILMSVAYVLMLLEDAGNIRHTLMSYVQAAFNEPDQGIFGTIFEFFYFAVLGGLPLYALIRYWNEIKTYRQAKKYLVAGFIFYALASSLSFIGTAFEGLLDKNIYTIMGEKLYALVLLLADQELSIIWGSWNNNNPLFQIGFFLMDSLVEESLELMGGGAFLAAAVSYWKKNKKIELELVAK